MKNQTDRVLCSVVVAALACLGGSNAVAAQPTLSDQYSMEVDPESRTRLGDEVYQQVMGFFHDAELAIETQDLDSLMEHPIAEIREHFGIPAEGALVSGPDVVG